jgi:acetyl-CoA carboxylase carboxyltransferase component
MDKHEQAARHAERRRVAEGMGGPAKLRARAERGVLNARERVDLLFDVGTFNEFGRFATASREGDRATTPTDGKVTGTGSIGGRPAAAVAYDFTVKGASSGPISNKKMQHMKDLSRQAGMPMVYLSESTGVRIPDIMGGYGMSNLSDRTRFLRQREAPWVSAVFGYSFGSATWHAVCSDITVVRKGAVMAVSSPGLVAMATGRDVDREELGGWRLHAEVTGCADAVAETDEEAIALVRRYLSYLPANSSLPPPALDQWSGPGRPAEDLRDIVPTAPSKVYDVHEVLDCIADAGTLLELKAAYARNLVTAFCRIEGRVVGLIANNPRVKAGAIDADACDKATNMLVLCDSYNIPVTFVVDQPGFLIGPDAERGKIAGKVINWMNALSLMTVPKVTVIVRKNYGQALVNMGGADTADAVAAWWSAQVSFMDPRSAVYVVHGLPPGSDDATYDERLAEMSRGSTAYDLAGGYGAHAVIDPVDTRHWVTTQLSMLERKHTGGTGQHLLKNWPTTF